jgi:2-polyprenyl-3-methyl-5-hydroxy-6-metoxy-1,4-benzoquinol methylase
MKEIDVSWYDDRAAVYDTLHEGSQVPYESVVNELDNLFKPYGVRTVLDMACGTGGHALLIAQRGYQVTGSDLSAAMIAEAAKKAQNQKLPVAFHQGDMRTACHGSFDALICMNNSFGHITEPEDFSITLSNFRKNLKPGGLLFIDHFNGSFMQEIESGTVRIARCFTTEDGVVVDIERSVYSEELQSLIITTKSYTQKHSEADPVISSEVFRMKLWTKEQMAEALVTAGFQPLAFYDGVMSGKLQEFKGIESPSLATFAQAI